MSRASVVQRIVIVAFAFSLAAQRAPAQCDGAWLDHLALPGGLGPINSLLELPSGQIVAGGQYQTSSTGGTLMNIALYNGAGWVPLGTGISHSLGPTRVDALAATAAGGVIAAGWFDFAGGVPVNNVALWDGSAWHALGLGVSSVGSVPGAKAALTLPSGDVIVAGAFNRAGVLSVNNIARWDGENWHRLANGINGGALPVIFELALLPNGDLVAAGEFQYAGQVAARNVARWDGAVWHPLGAGLDSLVKDIVTLPSGEIIATGRFFATPGSGGNAIARWDGQVWSGFSVDPSPGGTGEKIELLPTGDIVVGVRSSLKLWNGTEWRTISQQAPVTATSVLANGDLLAGGWDDIGIPTAIRVAQWHQFDELTICSQPADREPCLGGPTNFYVIAGGDESLTFQWQRNEIDLIDTPGSVTGANTSSLTLENAAFTDEADRFRCIISGNLDAVVTRDARLSICPGQLDCLGGIDIADLAILLTHFGTPNGATYFDGDLNLDGAVDLPDLALLLQRFGTWCD